MSFDVEKKRPPALVPYWVIRQLERHRLPMSTIFDLEKMSTISSLEDLAVMLSINERPDHAAVFYGCLDTEVPLNALSKHWSESYNQQYGKIKQLLALVTSVDPRLLYNENQTSDFAVGFEVMPIETGLSNAGALMIAVYPGFFGGPHAKQVQQELVREYLKQTYGFVGYHTTAKDPLFAQYLRTVLSHDA